MKHQYLSFFAAGALLALSACSADDPAIASGDGFVTFSVQLPGNFTRGLADGVEVNKLYYSVFDKGSDNVVITSSQEVTFSPTGDGANRSCNIKLDLVKGAEYDIVWWAQNKDCEAYTVTGKNLSVDYSKMAANDSKCDAFYGHISLKVEGASNQAVTLTRPFAQVNFGTSDLGYPAVTSKYGDNLVTSVTVKGNIPTQLNLADGTTSADDTKTVTFTYGKPAAEEFAVDDYKYLAAAYVLTTENLTADLAMAASADGETALTTVEVSGAPLKANYRTNIYGQLLTATQDFTVTIEPIPGGNHSNTEIWDGITTTEITPTTKNINGDEIQVYEASSASELAWIAEQINTEGKLKDAYIELANDIDFNNKSWTPIASATRSGVTLTNSYSGIFDGGNHTLKNLVISSDNSKASVGLFGALSGENTIVKNIKFENIQISGTGGQVGAVAGSIVENAKVENITIMSGSISGNEGVGGIVGRIIKQGSLKNCNNNAEIKCNGTNSGGIVGVAYYSTNPDDLIIEDCHNTGNVTASNICVGGIVGLNCAKIKNCTNTGTIKGENNCNRCVGGIIGQAKSTGCAINCTNSGDVILEGNTTNGEGIGGIVGAITYEQGNAGSAYPNIVKIEVSKCTNSGKVISNSNAAGGIVGSTANYSIINDNINNAPEIKCLIRAAGIVGVIDYLGPSSATLNTEFKGNTNNTSLANIQATGEGKTYTNGLYNKPNPPAEPKITEENNTTVE